MSQASTNVAAALSSAQVKKAARITKPATKPPAQPIVRRFSEAQAAPVITLTSARRFCPDATQAANISRIFGLDPVDFHAIREITEEAFATSAKALADNLNERALQMHLQRLVDGYVRSAHGAGTFYETKADQARDLSSKIANGDRDEDRAGVDATEGRAERARSFAATAALQAFAILAAAEGAADAYHELTGDEWKPYARSVAAPLAVARQSLNAQLGAFAKG